MSRRLVACLVAVMLLFGGTAFAAVNGFFEGYPIVSVVVDGSVVETDVPAVILESRTMVPLRFVSDALGADVTWDQSTYTAEINSQAGGSSTTSARSMFPGLPVDSVYLSIALSHTLNTQEEESAFAAMVLSKELGQYDGVHVIYPDNSVLTVHGNDIDDLKNNKITSEEFISRWAVPTLNTLPSSSPAPLPAPTAPLPPNSTIDPHNPMDRLNELLTSIDAYRAAHPLPKLPAGSMPLPHTEPSPNSVIESRIDGEFEGWDGDTIFKLANGQIWQQTSYAYTYHYAYRPKVLIYKSGTGYKMLVEGVNKEIGVKRIK